MYIKFLGGILIVASSYFIGRSISLQYSKRLIHLNGMITALKQLETYIVHLSLPIPEAFGRLAQVDSISGNFFRQFASLFQENRNQSLFELWELCTINLKKNSYLTSEDIDTINDLGKFLGLTNRVSHKEYFAMFFMRINHNVNDAMENQKKYSKLYQSLGFLTGMIIFIVIL